MIALPNLNLGQETAPEYICTSIVRYVPEVLLDNTAVGSTAASLCNKMISTVRLPLIIGSQEHVFAR